MHKKPALSTMWSQLRHDNLIDFMTAAHSIGFEHVELSHIITPQMIKALPQSLFSSVRVLHHPCPNAGGVPEISDPNESKRIAAVKAATQTIEWSAKIGADLIVMHLGVVGVDRRWENAIRARWLQGQRFDKSFHTLSEQIRALRATQAPLYFAAARRSLAELVPIAHKNGVRIALENGEWCFSMPNLAEARHLLSEFDTPTLGIWIDTGHATIQERLGFGTLLDWANLAPNRLLGLHYHDVDGIRDHVIPGNGTIDWAAFAEHIPMEALPTCEFDWYYSADEIRAGVECLVKHGLVLGSKQISTLEHKSAISVPESALLSELALAKDWNRPEEDAAWSYLQSDQ